MILSPTCEYSMRALICLANSQKNCPILSQVIARQAHIPPHFARKILRDLRRHGLVNSTMGPGGGFTLSRRAEKIKLKDVFRATEGMVNETRHCVLGLANCDDKNPCPMHNDWKRYRNKFSLKIENVTIAELAAVSRRKKRASN